MKKFAFILALFIGGYTISNASILTKNEVELTVGSNPVSILENPTDGLIHIFCAGIDANDNNIYDEGEDEKPSWWTYNPTGSSSDANRVKEFDNYFVSPFKPMMYGFYGNKGAIRIPFACTKVSGEYLGQSKFVDFGLDLFDELFEFSLTDSEYLISRLQQSDDKKFSTIEIIRDNGGGFINYVNGQTGDSFRWAVGGKAIDFTFVDVNDDGKVEIAILIDNMRLDFFEFSDDYRINLISSKDLTTFPTFTGEFGRLITYGNFVYTNFKISNDTIANWHKTLKFSVDSDNRVRYKIIENYTDLVDIDMNTYPLSESQLINTNTSHNLLAYSERPNFLEEMHRTASGTDLVLSTENTVYISSKNKVLTYDYTNETYIDEAFKFDFFLGYQPVDLLYYNNRYNIVSLGVDFNFDGNIDEAIGDQKPSIHSFDSTLQHFYDEDFRKDVEFDFPINFPLNTNISPDGDLPLPSGNSVHFYNVESKEVYDTFDAGMYVSCAFSVMDYLVLGQRDLEKNKSYIRIKKGDFIDVNTEVGANVVDCIVYQNASGFGVVSVSEGNFGKADSKINLIKLSTKGIEENSAIEVGTGGISISTNLDKFEQTKAAIVMNGSHEIHILNLLTGEIDLTFSTGTSGYGGPREAVFYNDNLFVTTYSNQVMMFDVNTGKRLSSINIDGNSESIIIENTTLFVANNQYSNYEASNRVYAYDIDKITSVEKTVQTEQSIRVYPNPVANDFHLVSDDLAGTNDIAIINSQGKIVATYSGSSNGAIALNADALGLTSGNYTAVINGTRAVRFVVIK